MTDLHVLSFGYVHGELPPEVQAAKIVIDVRGWFRDPHVDPELREMTGMDQVVIDKVTSTPGVQDFVAGMYRAVSPILHLHQPVTVAFGCVGGRHRSVVIASLLAKHASRFGWSAEVEHLHVGLPVTRRTEAGHG